MAGMKVGFTGTREGMTEVQANEVSDLVSMALHSDELHHGDCVGADEEFHNTAMLYRAIAFQLGHRARIISHPPKDERFRAFCEAADEVREPKDYIARNRDIVDETDVLIAAPKTPTAPASLKGQGTWSTVFYALGKHKTVYVVAPDGTVSTPVA